LISLLFSLLATSILSFRFPTESLRFSLLVFISSIVGVSVVSISDDSLASIGKVVALSALATKIVFSLFTIEVFSTSDFGVTKKLLYISLAPNCIVAQEAFGFCVAVFTFFVSCFFTSLTVDFAIWSFVMASFCFSTSFILFSSENVLVPFIKKSTASPTEYFTFSYLLAIDRKFFSVLCKLLFPIFVSPKSYFYIIWL